MGLLGDIADRTAGAIGGGLVGGPVGLAIGATTGVSGPVKTARKAVGGVGKALGSGERQRSRELLESAITEIEDLPQRSLGELSQTAVGVDPEALAAQRDALAGFREIAAGGVSPRERLERALIDQQSIGRERAARQAALLSAQRRGAGGSGAALASALTGGQTSATSRAIQGLGARAATDARRQAALGAIGNLGSSLQGQATQRASLEDLQRRFGLGAELERRGARTQTRLAGAKEFGNLASQRAKASLAAFQGLTGAVTGGAKLAGSLAGGGVGGLA